MRKITLGLGALALGVAVAASPAAAQEVMLLYPMTIASPAFGPGYRAVAAPAYAAPVYTGPGYAYAGQVYSERAYRRAYRRAAYARRHYAQPRYGAYAYAPGAYAYAPGGYAYGRGAYAAPGPYVPYGQYAQPVIEVWQAYPMSISTPAFGRH
jgi:hypothetical protein